MSDDAADASEAPPEDDGDDVAAGEETPGSLDDVDVWRYLRLGAIGLLALLALIATVQLYTNTSAAIAGWISPDYVPVFQAVFNLVVLLLALAGLATIARRR